MAIRGIGNSLATFRDRFNRTGVKGGIPRPFASGGTITTSGLYTIHTFTSSGSFEINGAPPTFAVEYLVVGGGGGGGNTRGGGGGGGGLRSNHPSMPAPLKGNPYPIIGFNTFTVIVGNGGSGRPYPSPGSGTPGGDSEFYPTSASYPSPTYIRSVGGGVAAGRPTAQTAGNGGSGGGGSQDTPNWPGGLGNSPSDPNNPIPQGNPGGTSVGPEPGWRGSGGGGSGGAGAAGGTPASYPGAGGPALSVSISGSSVTYAGGGGAGAGPGASPLSGGPADPSAGAGGAGPGSPPSPGSNAPSNRGGGGGGGGDDSSGGNGGSGIVIIRYLT